jgi:S1-C subfamily serine protease
LQPGDVIYKLDDKPVGTVDDIRHHLERLAEGTAVRAGIIRMTSSGVQTAEATIQVHTPRRR